MAEDESQKRKTPRFALKRDLSQHLTKANGAVLRGLGTETSNDGLGIVAFEMLKVGDKVMLNVNDKKLTLIVVWSKQDPVRKTIFHAGLQVADANANLLDEFTKLGYITVGAEEKV